jgi:hypothetical protein
MHHQGSISLSLGSIVSAGGEHCEMHEQYWCAFTLQQETVCLHLPPGQCAPNLSVSILQDPNMLSAPLSPAGSLKPDSLAVLAGEDAGDDSMEGRRQAHYLNVAYHIRYLHFVRHLEAAYLNRIHAL